MGLNVQAFLVVKTPAFRGHAFEGPPWHPRGARDSGGGRPKVVRRSRVSNFMANGCHESMKVNGQRANGWLMIKCHDNLSLKMIMANDVVNFMANG